VRAKSICVFCGSRVGNDPAYAELARRLGAECAARGVRLVYGGGRIGLMGILADAALSAGGEVVGVIPEFLQKLEVGNGAVSELHLVGSMHERKQRMFDLADAFVTLPGGLGTFDETIEIITWKQLRLHSKPVVLINHEGYWEIFRELVGHAVTHGFAHGKVRELFTLVDGVDDVFAAIDAAPEPDEAVLSSHL
jgi:uncharacterized protein (TIGR00730 family)